MSVSLTAGQTEATVGMAVSCPISQENPSPVFGLPAILCGLCPQYKHKIIFSKKCYNERKCPLPAVLVFIHRKTSARAAAQRSTVVKTQNFPQVLATLLPPRRPAPNLFKRFLAWAWSKSAFNDPTREMTSFGWRKKA